MLDKTTIYEYNENGDIESKKYYHYSENDELEAIRKQKTVGGTFCGKYYCGESVVCDRLSIYVPMETYFKYDPYGRLTDVGDKQISYDDNGRPLNYLGTEIEWNGSRMKKYGSSEYEYDGDNCRLSKTVKGKKRLFFYDVQNALRVERTEEGEIHYLYDASGVRGFEYVEYSVPGAALSRAKYYYEKDLQGNIVGIVNSEGTEIVKYEYVDAWGSFNEYYLTDEGRVVAALNSFTYRGYYYDKESGLYYLINRYYDPETGRFISPDDVGYLDFESFFGTNRYAYCLDDPVNESDPDGTMPNWLKWVIGGVVIVGLIVATFFTGGASAGVAGYIVAGALKGAVIGAVSGALVSGTIGGISSAIAGNGFWNGFADGAADGFMLGAIIGAITGAISSSLQIANSAKCWDRGNYRSAFESMKNHYKKHVIKEGFQKGNNIVKYTKDAMSFANRNASVLKFQPAHTANLRPNWSWVGGKLKMNGQFTSAGKILTFWYVELS